MPGEVVNLSETLTSFLADMSTISGDLVALETTADVLAMGRMNRCALRVRLREAMRSRVMRRSAICALLGEVEEANFLTALDEFHQKLVMPALEMRPVLVCLKEAVVAKMRGWLVSRLLELGDAAARAMRDGLVANAPMVRFLRVHAPSEEVALRELYVGVTSSFMHQCVKVMCERILGNIIGRPREGILSEQDTTFFDMRERVAVLGRLTQPAPYAQGRLAPEEALLCVCRTFTDVHSAEDAFSYALFDRALADVAFEGAGNELFAFAQRLVGGVWDPVALAVMLKIVAFAPVVVRTRLHSLVDGRLSAVVSAYLRELEEAASASQPGEAQCVRAARRFGAFASSMGAVGAEERVRHLIPAFGRCVVAWRRDLPSGREAFVLLSFYQAGPNLFGDQIPAALERYVQATMASAFPRLSAWAERVSGPSLRAEPVGPFDEAELSGLSEEFAERHGQIAQMFNTHLSLFEAVAGGGDVTKALALRLAGTWQRFYQACSQVVPAPPWAASLVHPSRLASEIRLLTDGSERNRR